MSRSTLPLLYLFPGSNFGETRWPVCVWSIPTGRELGSHRGTLCWWLVSDIHTRGCFKCSWGSTVYIVTMQRAGWPSNCGLIPRSGDRIFCSTKVPKPTSLLIQCVPVERGFHPPWHKSGHEANHSSPPSTKVENEWGYISIPPYACMARTWTSLPLPSPLAPTKYVGIRKVICPQNFLAQDVWSWSGTWASLPWGTDW